jgi:ribose transport system permease protein
MSSANALTSPSRTRSGFERLRSAVRGNGVVWILVLLFLVLSVASDSFLTKTNLLNILDQSAAIGIIACGSTFVLIAGGLDLSVGAIFAFSGVLAAEAAGPLGVPGGLLAGVLAGLALGLANGVAVTWLRVNSLVGTLGSALVIRGFAVAITGASIILVADTSFGTLGTDAILGIKYSIVVWALFAALLGFVLWRTRFGRHVYAVGGNPEAARLSGVRVELVRTITFGLSGLAAGLAGVLVASRVGTGQADVGTGYELTAIAAIVIGGTSIAGGRGAIWRTVVGVLLLALIGNGMNLLNVAPNYQLVVQGAILIVAVGLDAWIRGRTA